jgi:hypothetical protein
MFQPSAAYALIVAAPIVSIIANVSALNPFFIIYLISLESAHPLRPS